MSHVYDSLLTLLNNKPPAITFLCSDNTFDGCNMPWGYWFLKSVVQNLFCNWLFIILNQLLFLLLTAEKVLQLNCIFLVKTSEWKDYVFG